MNLVWRTVRSLKTRQARLDYQQDPQGPLPLPKPLPWQPLAHCAGCFLILFYFILFYTFIFFWLILMSCECFRGGGEFSSHGGVSYCTQRMNFDTTWALPYPRSADRPPLSSPPTRSSGELSWRADGLPRRAVRVMWSSLTTETLDNEGRSLCAWMCVCAWMCACVRVCCMCYDRGRGWGCVPYRSDILVLDLLEREDVTYKVDSTVNADRSLSSWPPLPVLLCFNALSLCQWTHSSHYGCTCAFY